jgi:hypothetical protein
MLTCGAVAHKAVTFVEDLNLEPEEATENKPLRVATSRPLWADSQNNLSSAALDRVFAHTSTADAEVRRGAAKVAAQAAQV